MRKSRPACFLQALAHAALFYLTVGATCSLVLLFALFNRGKRTVHDLLAGTLMVPASPPSSGFRPGDNPSRSA